MDLRKILESPAILNTGRRERYHHGDLRSALVRASDEILRENGIEGFTLRAAARHAGVSPGAPAHHFGSVAGLLTEVAILGYEELGRVLSRVNGDSAAAVLRAQAAAYVGFALDHPGRFRLMFRKDLVDRSNAAYRSASAAALGHLARSAIGLQGKGFEDRRSPSDLAAIFAAWSTIHGIAHLALENKFDVDPQSTANNFQRSMLPLILLKQWPDS